MTQLFLPLLGSDVAGSEAGLTVFGLPPTVADGVDGGLGIAPYARGTLRAAGPPDQPAVRRSGRRGRPGNRDRPAPVQARTPTCGPGSTPKPARAAAGAR